ncbi:FdhF/YdeP family oxidoreductase [Fulvimonas sp. R45]|uniref:FdhF/YdeP family oxidoreductase n=1 Tax=Fulvimonas sp. R45 TaxID=3045937 RepID=UPI00265F2DD4|nr:FdhF/YdeP family oxidoreductase [Fulvimonas sp. R45]MDO1528744.1 FdhF/YdeP family oxidoreductase [Fulvimonas sp. R45]
MSDDRKPRIEPYTAPAGGWGSVKSVAEILKREKVPIPSTVKELWRQNKPRGFTCVSCAWPQPGKPLMFEFCENGAKASAWELTSLRTTPEFFAQHTVSELRGWSDYELEQNGRLTHPLRYDRASDRYVPVAWEEAFRDIGAELKKLDPKSVVFYASGRASLETSYLYALFARLYGNNNLPDSSNMCHEATGVALRQCIGTAVGTVVLDDFEKTDGIFFFGQNAGVNSPRMMHDLQKAAQRGVPIIVFNPVRERGLERFTNPQNPVEMLTGQETPLATQYHQVKTGGDIAAIAGLCKTLLALDDEALANGAPRVLDTDFIAAHTHGFDAFAAWVRAQPWDAIEADSGLTRAALEGAARVYARCNAVIGVYGMGLTQHVLGEYNIYMVANLLLMRGNLGKPGAGICPVRGHSNVQGQRTVGIADDPALVPLDRLAEQYGFEPPRERGLHTVEACKGVLAGSVHGFIGLGGNFLRAIPDQERVMAAWGKLRLTVQIATKLNRTHLVNGEVAYLLPCLGRIERVVENGKAQVLSTEDSTSCIHASVGKAEPASPDLLSETRIVVELAKATLPPNPKVPWNTWVNDYATIRDAIEQTYPEQFRDFNRRMWQPGGFHRPNSARERVWKTATGKANLIAPPALVATGFDDAPGRFRLMTMRSNDQFNTTVYGYDDRFRGIHGTRDVVMMHRDDIAQQGLREGQVVKLVSDAGDGIAREVGGLSVVAFDIPRGCIGGYYPECNPLIPLSHHTLFSMLPAAKSVPVRVVAEA